MTTPLIPILPADLTTATLDGDGMFDTLMRATKAHLEQEFGKGRIKGAEYATVYLGSLESTMRTSSEFLLQRQRNALEAQLIATQVQLAEIGLLKAGIELQILTASLGKVPAEIALLESQTAHTIKQTSVIDEDILIKKQQVLVSTAEVGIAQAKLVNIPKEGAQLDAQTALAVQQKLNLVSEELSIDAKTAQIDQQTLNLAEEALNIPIQGTVLTAQKCKLDAEFDLLQSEKLKSISETALLTQKNATEKAQVTALGVDADSVVGRQKELYVAQTNGFQRDAEQKATKILLDTWNVKRTTNEAEPAIVSDVSINASVAALVAGIS